MEGEVTKLGNSFLSLSPSQRYHLKLYPNRLEFQIKKNDGQIDRKKQAEVGFDVKCFWCGGVGLFIAMEEI